MGTRGLFGFYYKKKYYLVYNHLDSYPSGLGETLLREIIEMIKNNEIEKWIEMLTNIKIVYETDENEDWYKKLRNNQGSFKKTLDSGYILTKDQYQINISGEIFLEYSYLLDFDNNIFKFFDNNGYQTKVKLSPDIKNDWNYEMNLYHNLTKNNY